MYKVGFTNRFKKDARLCKKRGYSSRLLDKVVEELMITGHVSSDYNPHTLEGNYKNNWECHIKPDWLLIWIRVDFDNTIDNNDIDYNTDYEILLVRTGSHSDLF